MAATSALAVKKNGTKGNDKIDGTNQADRIFGDHGNDTIRGLGGNDYLDGGKGHDHILGGAGRDTIYARDDARDTIDCGSGRDIAFVDPHDVVKNCEVVRRSRDKRD